MCSEKVNKSQVDPTDFCAPLSFVQQKCKKISSAKYAFFMHFEATKQGLEERIWF